jgi:hypothetical protein
LSANILQLFDPTVYLSLAFLFGIAAQFKAMDGDTFLRKVVASLFSPIILNDVVIPDTHPRHRQIREAVRR